jgi:hypothetical protein
MPFEHIIMICSTKELYMYNIEYINTVPPTVQHDEDSQQQFEQQYQLGQGEDIGGLVVYKEGAAVYDYENCCGWVK